MSVVTWAALTMLALAVGVAIGRRSVSKVRVVNDVEDECLRLLPPTLREAVTTCVETMSGSKASETLALLLTLSQVGKDGDQIDVAASYVISQLGALARTLSRLDVAASKLFIHTAMLEMRDYVVDDLIEKWLVPQTPVAPTSETTDELRRAIYERINVFLERAKSQSRC